MDYYRIYTHLVKNELKWFTAPISSNALNASLLLWHLYTLLIDLNLKKKNESTL